MCIDHKFVILFFFFKQNTAYEWRISDWSSDVCSSDLVNGDYRPRAEKIPTSLDDVTPEWLTHTLQHRYPDVVVKGFEQTGLKNSHTTKLRLRLDLNDAGREAGIPELVC